MAFRYEGADANRFVVRERVADQNGNGNEKRRSMRAPSAAKKRSCSTEL